MVDKMDFIALNHYMHHVKKGLNPAKNYNENPPDEVRSDLGWYVNPESLYHVLMSLKKYDKPIYIMEHGVADAGDRIRPWLIEETFKWIRKALKDGVDLRSYFHWSLVDNFEWNKGWFPKFGLIELNETTKERTVRQSGIVYSRCIKEAES
jgi:beta-glucosidase